MTVTGRSLLVDGLGWGLLLWLFGYVLGFVLFALVPADAIGWYIMPIGMAMTALVLWKWVKPVSFVEALIVGVVWCLIAVVLDYLFIVRLLAPADGYYKLDVYLYYLSAFAMPLVAALLRGQER